MELLFLWIEDFRNIKKQGFNFSSELLFNVSQLEERENLSAYKLKIDINVNYVNLFDGNIIDVAGVIGKNGSGKSTLLHCLKVMCGNLAILTSPIIFSLLDREDKTIKTYFYSGGGVEEMIPLMVTIEKGNSINEKFIIDKPKPFTIDKLIMAGSRVKGLDFDFKEIACCFFSNTFDSHRENIYEGIYNISTNYRVENFLKEYISKKEKDAQRKKEKTPKIEVWPSHILQYHKTELKTLLKFISYAKTRKSGNLPNLPEVLIVSFNFDDFEYLKSELHNSFLVERNIIEEIQKLAIENIINSKSKSDNFLNIVVLSSFYYALRKELFDPKIESMDKLKMEINQLVDSPLNLFVNIRNIMSKLSSNKNESSELNSISGFLSDKFIKSVQKIQFSDTNEVAENKTHYRLKIDNNLWSVLNPIFEFKSLDESTFIDYSWGSGLSSGQEAFFSHFARLYELKANISSKVIWLLIDEGDLYFHPEWQKNYFSNLVTFVKFLFPRNKVQIVITTHSPFIASDLPKQNLIFLNHNIEGKCIVEINEMQGETFGSNIHELFTNSFFLSDGLMGEFARNNIESLIKEINDETSISLQKYNKNYKNRIGIIGESFIKSKLFELVTMKSNLDTFDAIIAQKSDELQRLQQSREIRNYDKNRKLKS